MRDLPVFPFPQEAAFLFPLLGIVAVEGEGEEAGRALRFPVLLREGKALLFLDSPSGRWGSVQRFNGTGRVAFSKFEVCAGCGGWWESTHHAIPEVSDSIIVLRDAKIEYLSPWNGGSTGYCASCNLAQGVVWMELNPQERERAAKVKGKPNHVQSREYRAILLARFRERLVTLLVQKSRTDGETALRMVAKLGETWESALY